MFVDIFVGVVVLGSMIIAFLRGFIREVLTILGIVGGIVAAYVGAPVLAPHMYGWLGVDVNAEEPQMLFDVIPYPILADGLSYASIFLVFVIILSVFSHFFAEFVKDIGLGAVDRTLGVLFGFARGVLVLGLFYLPAFYLLSDEDKASWFGDSKTHVYLEATAKVIDVYMPETVKESMEESEETAETISETRKKLEEMNVLKTDEEQPEEEKKEGYTDEFRNKMDELIEQNVDTDPDFN